MGFSSIEDVNSPEAFCEGTSALDSTVDHKRQRISTMEAYLPRATAIERRRNLSICTRAIVSRIDFTRNEAQLRAVKVKFRRTDSQSEETFSVTVKKEVIVSSGAISSPQILMLRFAVFSPS